MRNNFLEIEDISCIAILSFTILTAPSLILGGCSAIIRTNHTEPKIIAVRNSSGINLSVVSLREVMKSGKKSVRMGSISPVQTGVTQIFNRPSSPPPLPQQVAISWADYAQRQYEREISLKQVLTDPNAKTRDTLVFEITPSGRINVYWE
jgi:hypothetical protein